MPSGFFKSSATDWRPRLVISFGEPPLAPLRSMRKTSAPISDSNIAQKGPGPIPANSMILTPFSGPFPMSSLHNSSLVAYVFAARRTRWRAILGAGLRIGACQREGARKTSMPNSRIFLRKVLRLMPSKSAARTWLPRVASRLSSISGRSTSRKTRSYNPFGGNAFP